MLRRFYRLRDAPIYLGMDKGRFNKEVRPHLTEIPIGKQGVAFDRLELDDYADQYVACNGRPAAKRRKPWDVKERRVSSNEARSGTSIDGSRDMADFERARESVISMVRRKS